MAQRLIIKPSMGVMKLKASRNGKLVTLPKPQFASKQPFSAKLNPTFNGALTPNLPGEAIGIKSVADLQQFNANQWKVKGYTISLPNNSAIPQNINISGVARVLIGISAHAIDQFDDDAAMPLSFNLQINNELFIADLPWTLIDTKYMTNIFYPFRRALAGTDEVIATVANPGAQQTVGLAFYYL